MKVPRCVLEIEDASNADLSESNSEKSQKTLRADDVRKPVSFKLLILA